MHINFLTVFSIPLYYDSKETFSKKLKKRFENEIRDFNPKDFSSENEKNETLRLLRSHFSSRYPDLHKYNNILGYAELMIDGNDILIYYFLNGDKRKKYNRNGLNRNNRGAIFHSTGHCYGGKFKKQINSEFKLAFKNSLVEIEKQCKEWNVFVDTKYYVEIIEYFNFEGYLKHKISVDKKGT